MAWPSFSRGCKISAPVATFAVSGSSRIGGHAISSVLASADGARRTGYGRSGAEVSGVSGQW